MSMLSTKLRLAEGGLHVFMCPGCKRTHFVGVGPGEGPRWSYNGNPEAPTFQPSILVTSGHYIQGHNKETCWCTYNADHPGEEVDFTCGICHSFVTDGQIQFLGDCTHELAGQTVPLPEWTE